MKVDMSEVAGAPGKQMELSLTVTPTVEDQDGDFLGAPDGLSGRLHAYGTERGALVHFQFGGEVELRCARCLQPFRYPARLDFTEEFRSGEQAADPVELETDEDGETYVSIVDGLIPVDEVVRQHLLLALPMKPLCHPDCAGLCPTCGANLNEGPCRCEPEVGDPRLAVLRKLLNDPEAGQ